MTWRVIYCRSYGEVVEDRWDIKLIPREMEINLYTEAGAYTRPLFGSN
jgi:hypothetical protein